MEETVLSRRVGGGNAECGRQGDAPDDPLTRGELVTPDGARPRSRYVSCLSWGDYAGRAELTPARARPVTWARIQRGPTSRWTRFL